MTAALKTMTEVWMGDISLAQARTTGLVRVSGPRVLIRNVNRWLGPSPFADIPSARPTVPATA
jgi:hypothetical protein